MTAAYLAKLNAEQRRAVEHGCAALDEAPPLLIIAGAGSGKTNTLANRVAHLIVSGADPRRIMLLTFSRRAAAEMQRRVERITAEVLGAKARPMAHALNWSGTFHAIGARLLREYSLDIGLSSTFTIHDREDSGDLMNLVRHDLGLSTNDKRFPMKGTCLSIYSRAVNAEAPLGEVLDSFFPWCAEWEAELRTLFGAYVEAKQKQNVLDYDDLLLYWAQMMVEGAVAQDVADRFDHVLVDEYQDTTIVLQGLLNVSNIAADANAALRLALDTQKKRHHTQYSPLRRRQFDCWRRQGATTDALRGCFIVRAILAIARRDEDREQPTNESSLTRHGKIQLAFGFSFEEGAGDVRSAASVKAKQNVIVAVENRDRPRRCHQRCSIPKTSKMRPLAVAGSAL